MVCPYYIDLGESGGALKGSREALNMRILVLLGESGMIQRPVISTKSPVICLPWCHVKCRGPCTRAQT